MGADELINVDEASPDERLERVKQATHGLGANVVVECTGSPRAGPRARPPRAIRG